MPEYAESENETPIPNLFPNKLLDSCLNKVQCMIQVAGEKVEKSAEKQAQTYR